MTTKLIQDVERILDTPLNQWTMGQLKFEVASQLNDPSYVIMLDYEKEDRKYPITKDQMIEYLKNIGNYK